MRRLYRSTTDRMIAGVCGGLGHYMNVDPTVVRIVVVVLALVTILIPFALAYIACMLLIPPEPSPGLAAPGAAT